MPKKKEEKPVIRGSLAKRILRPRGPRQGKVKIQVIDYTEKAFKERDFWKVKDCVPFKKTKTVTWINVTGVNDENLIRDIAKGFGLHPLVVEDIIKTDQRPKMEDYEDYLFLVLKMIDYSAEKKELEIEQLSLVIGKNFVLSFQETEGDIFDPIREAIRKGKRKIRKLKCDYLAYTLIDAVVDNYFNVLEKIGDNVEEIEQALMVNATPRTLHTIYGMKRELIFLRKSVWPLREVISIMERRESKLISPTTSVYLRDVYDHTIRVMDAVETLRDIVSGMLDIYLSSISNKLNEVMKVLTIISTIFIPLTFITGIYGMNFTHLPEVKWRYGYLFVWCIIIVVAIALLVYFRRKKWI
jgi:magnesium transporter